MGITLAGVRIKEVSLKREEDGKFKVSGEYQLLGSNNMVLATQTFGPSDYHNYKHNFGGSTGTAIVDLVRNVTEELNLSLGFGRE